jgi:uncharacterized protein
MDIGIWRAAAGGDLAEVQRLVGQDPGLLQAKSPAGSTPLMRAAARGHLEVVRWLVNQGAALDEQDRNKCTALCFASSEGHSPVVRLLLARGADPKISDNKIRTPLLWASNFDRLETVRCLLDHPSAAATVNHGDKWGRTALRLASGAGNQDVVRALLARGADPHMIDKQGKTPMIMAQVNFRPACVEALKVRLACSLSPSSPVVTGLTGAWGLVVCPWRGGQEAERPYQL